MGEGGSGCDLDAVCRHLIEPVCCCQHATEGAVELDPKRHVADAELLSDQRAAEEADIGVIDRSTGIAPVREAVNVDDPVAGSACSGEGSRVNPHLIAWGIFAPGGHEISCLQEQGKDHDSQFDFEHSFSPLLKTR